MFFFRDEPLSDFDAGFIAWRQGVATPGRSITVDPQSDRMARQSWLASITGAAANYGAWCLSPGYERAIVGAAEQTISRAQEGRAGRNLFANTRHAHFAAVVLWPKP